MGTTTGGCIDYFIGSQCLFCTVLWQRETSGRGGKATHQQTPFPLSSCPSSYAHRNSADADEGRQMIMRPSLFLQSNLHFCMRTPSHRVCSTVRMIMSWTGGQPWSRHASNTTSLRAQVQKYENEMRYRRPST